MVSAAVVTAVLGACTPLDGRSEAVEVHGEGALADRSGAEIPSWITTTVPPASLPAAVAALPPGTAAPTTSVPPPPATVPPTTVASPTTVPPAPPVPAPTPGAAQTERQRIVAAAVAPLGSAPARDLAVAALGQVRFDWMARLPDWQLRFAGGRSGVRGLTFPDRKVIEVYVRSGDTVEGLAHVIAHELGHAVDVSRLDDAQRSAWLAARGYSARTLWFPGASGVSDFATGAGDFAESFAWVHGPAGNWSGELGPPPNLLQAGLMAVLSGTA